MEFKTKIDEKKQQEVTNRMIEKFSRFTANLDELSITGVEKRLKEAEVALEEYKLEKSLLVETEARYNKGILITPAERRDLIKASAIWCGYDKDNLSVVLDHLLCYREQQIEHTTYIINVLKHKIQANKMENKTEKVEQTTVTEPIKETVAEVVEKVEETIEEVTEEAVEKVVTTIKEKTAKEKKRSKNAKFDDHDIKTIRGYYEVDKLSITSIAHQYEVTPACIWNIVNYKTYKDVK